MARRIILIVAVLFIGIIALRVVSGGRNDGRPGSLDAPFISGGSLEIDLRSGNYHISATDNDHVTVTYRDTGARDRSSIYFNAAKSPAVLEVDIPEERGGVEIGVPGKTNLEINLTAGNIRLSGIEGSKDVHCNAGNVQLSIGDKSLYGPVHLSALTGNIQARPWNTGRRGVLPSFSTTGPGPYALRVHVDAGNVVLTSQ